MPSGDQDMPKRLYVKVKEFNQNVCAEKDETIREEKWKDWVKLQKQQFWGRNDVENITIGDRNVFDQKVRFESTLKMVQF